MTMTELQAALTDCDRAYVDRTGVRAMCEAMLMLSRHGQWRAFIYLGDGEEVLGEGDTIEGAIDDLHSSIAATPPKHLRDSILEVM